jgi:hypothetical protein
MTAKARHYYDQEVSLAARKLLEGAFTPEQCVASLKHTINWIKDHPDLYSDSSDDVDRLALAEEKHLNTMKFYRGEHDWQK